MTTLNSLVEAYYKYRGLVEPKPGQALLFLVSELGELADAYVQEQDEWVRNNQKERCVPFEVGDVMMMLTVFCAAVGLDPVGCMMDKMTAKGFDVGAYLQSLDVSVKD